MAASPLVVAEDFASYLQRDLDRKTADLALASASGLVRHYCRWGLSAETITFIEDGTGTQLLSLPTLRLNAVAEVRVDGEVIPVTGYEWGRGGQLYRNYAVWPRRFRVVQADVQHGHTIIPDELRAVVFAVAARFYVNAEGLRSKTVGQVSRTFVLETMRGDLTDLETALIAGYRLP